MRYFDPELAEFLPGISPTDISDPVAARGRLAQLRAGTPPIDLPTSVIRTEVSVPRDCGAVRALMFEPAEDASPRPVVIYLHGGGFVMGDIDNDQALPIQITAATGAVTISVDYRLAPEDPHPAAVDDVWTVLQWVASGQAPASIDPSCIAISGASAGACIAAAVALRARRNGGPTLMAQVLDIPVLDDRAVTASSAFNDTPMWTRSNAEASWRFYLGAQEASADSVPARAADLTGLPPTYLTVCAQDPLRDSGIEFAQRLTDAGVPTELRLYPGTFHGAASTFPQTAIAQRMRTDLLEAIGRLLAPAATVDISP